MNIHTLDDIRAKHVTSENPFMFQERTVKQRKDVCYRLGGKLTREQAYFLTYANLHKLVAILWYLWYCVTYCITRMLNIFKDKSNSRIIRSNEPIYISTGDPETSSGQKYQKIYKTLWDSGNLSYFLISKKLQKQRRIVGSTFIMGINGTSEHIKLVHLNVLINGKEYPITAGISARMNRLGVDVLVNSSFITQICLENGYYFLP